MTRRRRCPHTHTHIHIHRDFLCLFHKQLHKIAIEVRVRLGLCLGLESELESQLEGKSSSFELELRGKRIKVTITIIRWINGNHCWWFYRSITTNIMNDDNGLVLLSVHSISCRSSPLSRQNWLKKMSEKTASKYKQE